MCIRDSVYPPPIVGSLFHIGIIARSIPDVLEVFRVVTNQNQNSNIKKSEAATNSKSFGRHIKPKKIKFFWSLSNEAPDLSVKNAVEKALEICSAAGVEIVQSEPALTVSVYEIFESKFLGGIVKKVSSVPNFSQFGDREIIQETERYLDQPPLSEKYVAAEIEKLEKFFCNA